MKQHTTCDFMLESSDWDGELDPKRCCARMWRGGFGGQCGKQAVVFDENLERWSVCENGWRLGLCKNHSGQLAKKGKLTHGYFDEVPEDMIGIIYEDVGNRVYDRRNKIQLIQQMWGDVGWTQNYTNAGTLVLSKQHKDIFLPHNNRIIY